jgi:hypothetical protein
MNSAHWQEDLFLKRISKFEDCTMKNKLNCPHQPVDVFYPNKIIIDLFTE